MSSHPLHRLFHPRSVAVVGASPKGGYGLTTLRNMRGVGFTGRLYVVHPTHSDVDGVSAHPTLTDLPEVPDAVAIAVPAARVPAVAREAAELGVAAGVVYASGFTETGDEGRRRQAELVEVCGSALRLAGPNCLGVASFRGRAALWGITMPFVHAGDEGTIAIAAQSGNMALTAMLSGRLPALAYVTSAGNQAVVDVCDCMEYYLSDPAIRVVGLIVEGVADLARFRRLAREAAERDVAVVALKVGRSAKGEQATISHTGTLAGVDAAYGALFRQLGVIRVDDLDEFIATCALLAGARRPRGRGLGVFASSGGECGLIADLAEDVGVELPDLDPETMTRLATVLPEYGRVGNPFDLTAGGWGQLHVYETAASALGGAPGVGVVAFVGDAPTHAGALADSGWPAMVAGAGNAALALDTPVALITTTTDTARSLPTLCAEHGVVLLAGLRPALRAISLTGRWAERRVRPPAPDPAGAGDTAQARALLSSCHGAVSETAAKALLELYGLETPPGELVTDVEAACAAAARIGYPVVCKADGLAHKSDVGGVEVGLGDEPSLRRAFVRVATAAGAEAARGIRIERMEPHGGVEVIVGGRNNAATGPLVVVGAGGVLAELIGDVAALVWPFSEADVTDALAELRLGRLLGGLRGAPASDVAALARAATAVGRLLGDLPEVVEIDINPVLVRERGRGAVALDGLVVLAQDTPTEEKG